MADRTSSSIDIDASPSEVMAVIADFEHYPAWVDSITSAEVLSTTPAGQPERVRMVLQHAVISDDYVLAYDWGTPDAVSWTLVEGKVLKAMDGSYAVAGQGDHSTVTYTLTVDARIPGMKLLRRTAEKTIIDGALKGLKKRVEG